MPFGQVYAILSMPMMMMMRV